VVVDHLGSSEKWKNLVPLHYRDYFDKEEFIIKLEQGYFGRSVTALIHMGACSSTTEKDSDYLISNNYRYSVRLGAWCEANPSCRFIYASSAATYGNGDAGYLDDHATLKNLRPMNMYGYSKQMFDIYALNKGWLSSIAGLKFYNVFGPNENHKGTMRSVSNKAYPDVRDTGTMKLFQSHKQGYAHGEQKRDFIYIKDVVNMILFFLDNTGTNGIFNIGTGVARSWNGLAEALFAAAGKKKNITYIPMPEELKEKYQYYTCSDIRKLKNAGWSHTCMSLEEAMNDYVVHYLATDKVLS
jgi:ADP-L-glycero-D-manno-heptose 6-epimerase